MRIEFETKYNENLRNLTETELDTMREIFLALINSGGLTGVKGGQTIIHFDADGIFQKIELKYFPWIRRTHKK